MVEPGVGTKGSRMLNHARPVVPWCSLDIGAAPLVNLGMSRDDLARPFRNALYRHHVLAWPSRHRHHEVKKAIGTLRLAGKVGATCTQKTGCAEAEETDVHSRGRRRRKKTGSLIETTVVRRYLESLPSVVAVHDLHIWALSTTQTALTVHLVKPDAEIDDGLLARTCEELRTKFGIAHSTIQLERGDAAYPCELAPEHVI